MCVIEMVLVWAREQGESIAGNGRGKRAGQGGQGDVHKFRAGVESSQAKSSLVRDSSSHNSSVEAAVSPMANGNDILTPLIGTRAP